MIGVSARGLSQSDMPGGRSSSASVQIGHAALATESDREDQGVDMMRFDGDGLIEDYRVVVRPLSAVVALRGAAFSQLPEAS